jgi:AraC-like DNA-binding protein
MAGLEAISHDDCPCRAVPAHRLRHAPRERICRHRHRAPFAAIVLAGSYVEAGDTGRHRVGPGDVVMHQAWEGHVDIVDARGADVLVVPLETPWLGPALGQVSDPDQVVLQAERDPREAREMLLREFRTREAVAADWPDTLALDLIADPALILGHWASRHGLHVGSIGRGFRKQFGITPDSFRASVRLQRAVRELSGSDASLGEIAAAAGFADQAHMSRTMRRHLGTTPGSLRSDDEISAQRRFR